MLETNFDRIPTKQGKKFTFITSMRPEMFVYTLHHRPKSLTDVKCKQTFFGLIDVGKVNFLLCMVRYTRDSYYEL